MNTDRELLELAAKAAGCWSYEFNCADNLPRLNWNPLENDGDALRLAVKLGMDLLFTTDDIEVVATQHDSQQDQAIVNPWAWESWRITQQDPYTATRRAIVRAAAAIAQAK